MIYLKYCWVNITFIYICKYTCYFLTILLQWFCKALQWCANRKVFQTIWKPTAKTNGMRKLLFSESTYKYCPKSRGNPASRAVGLAFTMTRDYKLFIYLSFLFLYVGWVLIPSCFILFFHRVIHFLPYFCVLSLWIGLIDTKLLWMKLDLTME